MCGISGGMEGNTQILKLALRDDDEGERDDDEATREAPASAD